MGSNYQKPAKLNLSYRISSLFVNQQSDDHAVQPQNAAAALLPPEILISILRMRQLSMWEAYDRQPFKTPLVLARDATLHAFPAVCKAWLPVGMAVLYERACLPSHKALLSFVRSMKCSPELRSLVQSIQFKTSVDSRKAKMRHQRAVEEIDALAELRDLCPLARGFEVMLCHPFFPPALIQRPPVIEHIISLQLDAIATRDAEPLLCTVIFPALEELTVKVFIVNSELNWLTMPSLRTLRFYRSFIPGPENHNLADKIHNLRRLELVHCILNPRTLSELLKLLSSTLEHLTVVNTYPSNMTSDTADLTLLSALQYLCVGPSLHFVLYAKRNLPSSLRHLAIWELKESEYSFFDYDNAMNNVEGLSSILNMDKDVYFPSLESITVRGEHRQWTVWEDHFRKTCADASMNFSLEMFDGKLGSHAMVKVA
ncbi:hypothetical protein BD410DRAFT_836255 [Rickenella mellea]|uniref:F-box domain-containing protein n=1 Tax=Rickenella mellea TaxID=50990 RepID=A0A4Y7QFC5_9AGAM|nr:hypothetical protein BD410DRAFT_836255 [Rickenella mellea]